MIFRFIRNHEKEYPVFVMCRVLGVSRGGYYGWRRRPESRRQRWDRFLRLRIREIHRESRGTYGILRVRRELRGEGVHCSRKRVARLMREDGLKAKVRKKFKATTDSRHGMPVAENLLDRKFFPEGPNRVWASDITYIWTKEGWLYLAVVLDLYSRSVVGWSMGERIDRKLVLDALKMAVKRRKPPRDLVHHSDRGSQYASREFRDSLEEYGMVCSMSRKGNCWDNAPVESFFGTLKQELVHHQKYRNRWQARQSLFEYIERFYNRRRLHSTLGYRTPVQFEEAYYRLAA